MRALLRPLGLVVVLATLAACDSQPTVDAPDLNGTYLGFGGGYTWEVSLAQNGAAMTGSGTVSGGGGSSPVTVTGSYTYPAVGLRLDAAGLDVFTFDGRVGNEGDLISGPVESVAGFDAETSFQRQ